MYYFCINDRYWNIGRCYSQNFFRFCVPHFNYQLVGVTSANGYTQNVHFRLKTEGTSFKRDRIYGRKQFFFFCILT